MAFAMDFQEEKQYRSRLNDSGKRLARLTAVELGYQKVAYVEPADSVLPGLWDVTAGDNRTGMGTFTTAELMTATTRLINRHSGLPWKPGQEKQYGTWQKGKRRPSRRRKTRTRKPKNRA